MVEPITHTRQGQSGESSGVDTDVLVVGLGPTGGTCALALATYGLRVMGISKRRWLADGPRAHITNQRALEVLRDLGVEEDARRVGTPWDLMRDMVFAESLAGREVGRLRTWGAGEERRSDYMMGSPCPLLDIQQPLLEPILVGNAAARGADVRFHTEYLGHQQTADGVVAQLHDRLTGHDYEVRSRYLVGADGAHSRVVDDLGLEFVGTMGRAGTVYVRFRCDLRRHIEHRPGILHRILLPAFGEIGVTTLRAVRPWDEWIVGWGYDLDGPGPATDADSVLDRVRRVIGEDDAKVDIVDVTTWQVNQAWATHYSRGRVFAGGDAVHRHPPSSGLGSNTSIQDAFNLSWKLAFVINGWAEDRLLESYSEERVPVGRGVVERANQSRADYEHLNAVISEISSEDGIDPDVLTDPSADGARLRSEMVKAMDVKNYEFNAQGVEMNHRYRSSAVLSPDDEPAERWDSDPELFLQATTRPGAKVPHVWLGGQDNQLVSTLDVVGGGQFTVLTGPSGQHWVEAVDVLELPFLRHVTIGSASFRDVYNDWYRVREIHEAGCLLVRPDGYVAWRHTDPVWDTAAATAELRSAIAEILGHHGE